MEARLLPAAELDRAWFTVLPSRFDPGRDGDSALPSGELERMAEGTYSAVYPIPPGEDGMLLFTAQGSFQGERLHPISQSASSTASLAPGGRGQARFSLEPGFPNPFRTGTTLRFTLAKAGPVRLVIQDLDGRVIRSLVNHPLRPGPHFVRWDGKSAHGTASGAGIFFAVLEATEGRLVRRLVMEGR